MLDFPMVKYKHEILELLAGIIAIPSVKGKAELNMPYGKDVFRALMYMLDQAERMDLESVNLFGHMGYASYGTGKETIGILTHLDVVPPGDGWDTDPYTATIKDGRVYGRGAVDNKGAAAAALIALYALKENCFTPGKQIKVFFGCDEESSWGDIDYYKANYPEIDYVVTPDAMFPIINREKGVVHVRLIKKAKKSAEGIAVRSMWGGTRANVVPNSAGCILSAKGDQIAALADIFNEDSPVKLTVTSEDGGIKIAAKGKAAHGSHPEEGDNAVTHLLAFLNTLPLSDGDVEKFIYDMNELIGLATDGERLGIKMEDELSGALTVNMSCLKLTDDEASCTLDIRFPISSTVDAIYGKVESVMKERGIVCEPLHNMEAHYVSEDTKLVTDLKNVYKEVFGEEGRCICCSGATYARAFKNSVAFGPIPEDRPSTEHGPNEYIEIDDLVKLAEALATAMVELSQEPLKDESEFEDYFRE